MEIWPFEMSISRTNNIFLDLRITYIPHFTDSGGPHSAFYRFRWSAFRHSAFYRFRVLQIPFRSAFCRFHSIPPNTDARFQTKGGLTQRADKFEVKNFKSLTTVWMAFQIRQQRNGVIRGELERNI